MKTIFQRIIAEMFFGLMIIAMILIAGLMGYMITTTIHDIAFTQKEYKTELKTLQDIQYMDNGQVLYKFGNTIIQDTMLEQQMQTNQTYQIQYIKYKNSWLHQNNQWIYYKIQKK